ncbi:MAG: DUF4129 domain-containing transglutaminase family protein, partial [Armatimonadota bacterium]
FINGMFGLTVLGFTGAWVLRRLGMSSGLLRTASFGLAVLAFFLLSGRGLVDFTGGEYRYVTERLLITTLSLVASIGSFFLVTDESVVFTGVWGLAIIGLAATSDVNFALIAAFGTFLLATIFLLVHQHALSRCAPAQRGLVVSGRPLRHQFSIAFGLWLASIALGSAISIPLRMVGRNLSFAQVVEQLRVAARNPQRRGATGRALTEGAGQFSIGQGPIRDDQTVLMRIWSTEPKHWRGRTYDVYTGHSWMSDQIGTGTELAPAGQQAGLRVFNVPRRPDARRLALRSFDYRIRAASPTLSLIYQPGDARTVRVAAEALFQTADGGLGAFNYLSEYEATAEESEATPEQLNQSGVEYSETLRRRYVAMDRSPRLAALAEEATRGARGPHDKAEAIRKFVADRCTYTLEARRVPDDRDAVDFFLNDSREGYCDLYASSVAVLARQVGLPARVATGFSQGEPDPDNPGAFLIRESHRHAWPEVYFEGYGWRPYDPTETTVSAGDAAARGSGAGKRSWMDRLRTFLFGPGGLIVFGTFAFLGAVLWTFRPGTGAGGRSVESWSPAARRLADLHRRCVRELSRMGIPRGANETLREHAERALRQLGPEVGAPYGRIVSALEALVYARIDPDSATLHEAFESAEAMRRAMAKSNRNGA